MDTIADNLFRVQQRIVAACQRANRDPASVKLVAVSKTQPADRIQQAVAAGQQCFGENRVQEARDKIPLVKAPQATYHLIGPLQRNKVKEAITLFHMIESVDSLEVAKEIHDRAGQPMPILVQVNVGQEPQKHGFFIENLEEALRTMAGLSNLKVQGLMTVPPWSDHGEQIRPYFRQLATMARQMETLAIPGIALTHLSMGMSGDFEIAIEEGATLVRVGSAIFGQRY